MGLPLSKSNKPHFEAAHKRLLTLAKTWIESEDDHERWQGYELERAIKLRAAQIRQRAKKLGI